MEDDKWATNVILIGVVGSNKTDYDRASSRWGCQAEGRRE